MRLVVIAGLIFLTVACGAYSFPGGGTTATGTVSGTVRVVPCAPVEQQGDACQGNVGTGQTIVFTNGDQTKTATVDSTGHYSINLAAGHWKVSFKGIARIVTGPAEIDVAAGGSIQADYVVDSGIRVPVPQA